MEKFREEKIRDNKKSVFIIGSIITIAILIIIGILSFKEKNNLANISSSMEEKKVTWQSDSQEKYLVDKIKYKKNFLDFYNGILEYTQDNLFAKTIKEKADKLDYANLQQSDKDVLEVYINEMFKITSKGVSTTDINNKKVNKAYWSDFTYPSPAGNYTFKSRLLYISFDDEPDKILAYRFTNDGDVYNTPVNTFDGTLTDGLKVYFEDKYNDGWKLHTETKTKTTEIIIKELDSNYLQQMMTNGTDLLDFLKQYRDEVYKPSKDKQLQIEAEERAKKQAEEDRIKNSIPQVGMTASEVRKSKWGSPDKINKDTYSWGTTEQWVYNKYGYVYFRNGVVSSVSQR